MVSPPGFGYPESPPGAQSEAVDWIAALRRPSRGSEMEAEFRAWLARDLDHSRAFDATTQIWELLGAAGKAFRIAHRRKVFRRAAITASAACVVVLLSVGVGAASHAVRRRKLSPA
jgi:ferric-dicitrate binding protein FerR (iron transport regulator)